MTATIRQPQTPASRSGDIGAIAMALAQPRQAIEAAFVDVGGRLVQCATLLNRITTVFEALPQDLESPELGEATARLAAVGRRAQDISAAFSAEQTDIARLVSVVTAADHPISDLRRTVKMMGIVAVNARVVAAGIVGDSDDFDVFTTDITTLSDGAARTIQDFSAAYRQLTEEVHRAASQRASFEASHSQTLSGLTARLEAILSEVTRHREASAKGSAETGHVSRQIAGRIASAVMALQVGDATRQRIEHIEAALTTLADLAEGKAVDDIALAQGELPAATAAISTLSSAQLAGANQAFSADIAEAGKALEDLAADARVVMTHSRDLYGQGSADGSSPLAALGTELRRAAAVLRDCEAERSKLEQVATAVEATVKLLLEHVEAVQEIEANMRLVSLNAAVKCAQLGPRGSALNVIARQLRELTGETVAAAEASMTGLTEAAALARSFGAASSGDAAGQVARLEQEALGAIGLLETVDARLGEALAILNRDGPAAISQLAAAASGFADHAAISEAMADIQIAIAALSPSAPDLAGIAQTCRPLLQRLYRSYTMDAERRTHHELFGADPATATPPPPNETAPAAEAEMDDIFF
jgi:hypothetical protein